MTQNDLFKKPTHRTLFVAHPPSGPRTRNPHMQTPGYNQILVNWIHNGPLQARIPLHYGQKFRADSLVKEVFKQARNKPPPSAHGYSLTFHHKDKDGFICPQVLVFFPSDILCSHDTAFSVRGHLVQQMDFDPATACYFATLSSNQVHRWTRYKRDVANGADPWNAAVKYGYYEEIPWPAFPSILSPSLFGL